MDDVYIIRALRPLSLCPEVATSTRLLLKAQSLLPADTQSLQSKRTHVLWKWPSRAVDFMT